jgi:hypothetical protein
MQLQSINNNSLIIYFCTVNNIIREIEMKFLKILKEMEVYGLDRRCSVDLGRILVKTLKLTINMVLKVNHVKTIEE